MATPLDEQQQAPRGGQRDLAVRLRVLAVGSGEVGEPSKQRFAS
jgi:hypothetical protein